MAVFIKSLSDLVPKREAVSSGELGATGTEIASGYITEEYNPRMQFPESAKIYDQMRRSDATVAATLRSVKLPILGTEFYIEPASEDAQDVAAAEFLEWALFDKLNFQTNFLPQALLYFDFGFMAFEKVYSVAKDGPHKGKVYYSKMAPRLPKSVESWVLDPEGGEPGIRQDGYRNDQYITATIPGWKLVRFTNEQEGDNYEGVSLLRPAYKHWYFKSVFEKIGAIAAERTSIGIPTLNRTEDGVASDKEKEENKKILRKIKANKEAYLDLGFGNDFKFVTSDGGFDFHPLLAHHDRQISKAVLAQFLETGAGSNKGGHAQNKTDQMMFFNSIESHAKYLCGRVNMQMVQELIDLNFNVTAYPKLRSKDTRPRDDNEFSTSIQRFVQSGALTPDLEVENAIRERIGVEPIDSKEAPTAPEPEEVKKKDKELADKKPMYVWRKVKNTKVLTDFMKANGVTGPVDDFHVTVAFSRKALDFDDFELDKNGVTVDLMDAKVKELGKALVIDCPSKDLEKRFKYFRDNGASWDFDGYLPHVSLSYEQEGQPEKIEAFSGAIEFGPEEVMEIDEEYLEIRGATLQLQNHTPVFVQLADGKERELTLAEEKIDVEKFIGQMDAGEDKISAVGAAFGAKVLDDVKKRADGAYEGAATFGTASAAVVEMRKETKARLTELQLEQYEFGKTEAVRELGKSGRIPTTKEARAIAKESATLFVQKLESDIVQQARFAVNTAKAKKVEKSAALVAVTALGESLVKQQSNNFAGLASTGMINTGIDDVHLRYADDIWGEQFSAVLDGKTTHTCLSLDGRVTKGVGGLPTPPLHGGCRSRKVSILMSQEPKPLVNKPPQSVIDKISPNPYATKQPKKPTNIKDSPAKEEIDKRDN